MDLLKEEEEHLYLLVKIPQIIIMILKEKSQRISFIKIGFFIKQFEIGSNIDGKEYEFKYDDVYDV